MKNSATNDIFFKYKRNYLHIISQRLSESNPEPADSRAQRLAVDILVYLLLKDDAQPTKTSENWAQTRFSQKFLDYEKL